MILHIFEVIGSLGLFLYGMRTMSDGIQKAAGDKLQATLKFMTGNRFAGVATGFGITTICSSSPNGAMTKNSSFLNRVWKTCVPTSIRYKITWALSLNT